MKLPLCCLSLATVAAASAAAVSQPEPCTPPTWEEYKAHFHKHFSCEHEESTHKALYERRAKAVCEHNRRYDAGEEHYRQNINKWTDVSNAMLSSWMGYEARPNAAAPSSTTGRNLKSLGDQIIEAIELKVESEVKQQLAAFKDVDTPHTHTHKHHCGDDSNDWESLPKHVDWRTPRHYASKRGGKSVKKSAITPVKEQGHCGSCYAFGTTETLESHHIIHTGMVVDLSSQMVADCSRRHPGHVGRGCGGGNAIDTWELATNQGVPTEWQYPYDSGHGTEYDCRFIPEPVNKTEFWNATPPVVKITGSAQVGPNDLFGTMHALATEGPLAISVDADNYHAYAGGIFDSAYNESKTDVNVDHIVQLVGYGSEHGIPYWIVRNSWGVDFGEEGFIRVRRGTPDKVLCKCPGDLLKSGNCTVGDEGVYRTAEEAKKETTLVCGADGILGDVSYPTGVYHIESTVEPH